MYSLSITSAAEVKKPLFAAVAAIERASISATEEKDTELSFKNGDYIFVPDVRKAVEDKTDAVKAYVVGEELKEITLKLGDLTDNEREIILKGCLINYYRG